MHKKSRPASALIAVLITASAALPACATPIRPDVQRLLSQPQAPVQFVPARAGWQGPETAPAPRDAQLLKTRMSAKAVRASLIATAIPDPRAVLGIAAAILFLRWLRLNRGRQQLRPAGPEEAMHDVDRAA